MNTNMKTMLHPYEFENHLWSGALSCCGWFASSFDLFLAWENIIWISLELSWISLFWVLLSFLDQPIWYLQLSISNDSRSPLPCWLSKHLACQSHSWAARPSPERSDLSKNHSWHSLEMNLVDWSNNGLVMMSNFGVCSKSFSFYLRLVLILNLSTKSVPKINQMALYPILVMLIDHFKTKPRFLNHL